MIFEREDTTGNVMAGFYLGSFLYILEGLRYRSRDYSGPYIIMEEGTEMDKDRDYWLERFNELFGTAYKSLDDIPRETLLKAVLVLLAAIELTAE